MAATMTHHRSPLPKPEPRSHTGGQYFHWTPSLDKGHFRFPLAGEGSSASPPRDDHARSPAHLTRALADAIEYRQPFLGQIPSFNTHTLQWKRAEAAT